MVFFSSRLFSLLLSIHSYEIVQKMRKKISVRLHVCPLITSVTGDFLRIFFLFVFVLAFLSSSSRCMTLLPCCDNFSDHVFSRWACLLYIIEMHINRFNTLYCNGNPLRSCGVSVLCAVRICAQNCLFIRCDSIVSRCRSYCLCVCICSLNEKKQRSR